MEETVRLGSVVTALGVTAKRLGRVVTDGDVRQAVQKVFNTTKDPDVLSAVERLRKDVRRLGDAFEQAGIRQHMKGLGTSLLHAWRA
jgi:hypothetical protein